MGEHGMSRRDQRPADKAELSNFLLNEFGFTHFETESRNLEATEYEIEE